MYINLNSNKNHRGILLYFTMDLEDIPITYENTLSKTEFQTKKTEFLKADRTTKIKQELSIYEDQSNMELLWGCGKYADLA